MRTARCWVAAAALAAVAAQAQQTAPDAAQDGRRLYAMACQRCHGLNLATNGIGTDLRSFPAGDKPRFVRSVTEGLRAMPAWGGTLAPAQIDLLWDYIASVNGWPSTAPTGVHPGSRL